MSIFPRLLQNRELVFTLVKRDLKVRYKASTLGFLWSFGRPLFLMLILWGVFSQFVGVRTEIPYPMHLLTGLLPWMFLQGALFEAQGSILYNSNVVKKVNLPSAAFPVAAVLGNLVHFILALCILACFIVGYVVLADPRLIPDWEIVLLPLIILLQTALLLGIALIVSSLNVFYRDVGSITEIFISAWFYMTPIIYGVQDARPRLKAVVGSDLVYYLYLCNPMTPIIAAYRRVLYGRHLRDAPEIADSTLLLGIGVSCLWAMVLLWIGSTLFARLSRRFADEL